MASRRLLSFVDRTIIVAVPPLAILTSLYMIPMAVFSSFCPADPGSKSKEKLKIPERVALISNRRSSEVLIHAQSFGIAAEEGT